MAGQAAPVSQWAAATLTQRQRWPRIEVRVRASASQMLATLSHVHCNGAEPPGRLVSLLRSRRHYLRSVRKLTGGMRRQLESPAGVRHCGSAGVIVAGPRLGQPCAVVGRRRTARGKVTQLGNFRAGPGGDAGGRAGRALALWRARALRDLHAGSGPLRARYGLRATQMSDDSWVAAQPEQAEARGRGPPGPALECSFPPETKSFYDFYRFQAGDLVSFNNFISLLSYPSPHPFSE
jgi:hypothetical protein